MNLAEMVHLALDEDLGSGDWTTRWIVEKGRLGGARVFARQEGILSGLAPFTEVFRQLDESIEVRLALHDGQRFAAGALVLELIGPLLPILTGERTALNFLQHLSGIATHTGRFVEAVRGTPAVILDTRKTTPLWRHLEKAAVVHGGGRNHRLQLSDMILVKDNHVALAGGIAPAIEKVQGSQVAGNPRLPIEVEVQNLEQLATALRYQLDRILLDNFTLDMVQQAVKLTAHQIPLEASGGVNLENISRIARTGVDFISIGALTHSAPALDFTMLVAS